MGKTPESVPKLSLSGTGQTTVAHVSLAKNLIRAGRYAQALEEIDAALRANPELPQAYFVKGLIHIFRADFDRARSALQQAVRFDASLVEPWLALAHAEFELGLLEAALQSADRGLALDPQLAQGHFMRANLLAALDRPEEAIAGYRRAIHLNPLLTEPRYKLGRLLIEAGREDEALQQVVTAQRLNPTDVNARVTLGNLLRKLGRHEEAIQQYLAGIKVASTPRQALPYAKLGETYLELGLLTEAEISLRAAVARNSKDVESLVGLGRIYLEDGRAKEAVEMFQAAVELDAAFPESQAWLQRAKAAVQDAAEEPLEPVRSER